VEPPIDIVTVAIPAQPTTAIHEYLNTDHHLLTFLVCIFSFIKIECAL
jgi:hypothetical protein